MTAENGSVPDNNFKVLVNHEEQYSLWHDDWPSAPGWSETGKRGSREECLEYVNQVWTDMRPLSLRRHMQSTAAATQACSETD